MFHFLYDYKTACVRYGNTIPQDVPTWDIVLGRQGAREMKSHKPLLDVEFDRTLVKEKSLVWDYEDKARQTLVEWKKITTNPAEIDASVVSADIKDSWIRCRNYGLDPSQKVNQRILTPKAL
jgi:hypothetical protein